MKEYEYNPDAIVNSGDTKDCRLEEGKPKASSVNSCPGVVSGSSESKRERLRPLHVAEGNFLSFGREAAPEARGSRPSLKSAF